MVITHGNILGVYHLANSSDRLAGAAWYPRAREIAFEIAQQHDISLETAVGVIAALSPRNKWSRNLADAENMIRLFRAGGYGAAASYKACTFGSNKKKALQILADNASDATLIRNILSGPKLQEFFSCIINDGNECVIDGHAVSIYMGERITLANTPAIGKKMRVNIKQAYAEAAREVGIKASEMQATTWLTWRRLHGIAD